MKKRIITLGAALVSLSSTAATQRGFDIDAYGFIKVSAMYASEALGSFNNINLVAPTHAVAQTNSGDNKNRMSFQAQQSRFGVNLKKDVHLSGKLEFDFIDFNKSSPTTQMNPRVRLASVTYEWNNQKVIIGQDWDLFSPVSSYTYDFVGLYFLAGNSGFMRQQIQYLKTMGKWELGAAVGMAGNNPGTTDSDLELGKSPSYAARLSYALEHGRMGISGIYSRLSYVQSNDSSHDAYGANLFFENFYGPLAVKSEVYYGQNLANLGSLTLGKGTDVTNVREFGGTFTFQYQLNEKHQPFAGIGYAKVDNSSELSPFVFDNTKKTITSAGIDSNFLLRLGWEYKVTEDLSWVSELSRYETTSKVADNSFQVNIASSVESGIQLKF